MSSILETRKDKVIILGVIIPLIIFAYAMFSPHISSPDHFAHIATHEAGLLIAGFLVSMTLIAYKKTRLPRMLFSAGAFATLTLAQGIYLFLEKDMQPTHVINSADEIFEFLIVIMTVLFAIGIFYKNENMNHN